MIVSSALYLLRRHGVVARLVQSNAPADSYDPMTGSVMVTSSRIMVRCVFVDQAWDRDQSVNHVTQKILIAREGLQQPPKAYDQIIHNDETYSITQVKRVGTSESVLGYICEAKHEL